LWRGTGFDLPWPGADFTGTRQGFRLNFRLHGMQSLEHTAATADKFRVGVRDDFSGSKNLPFAARYSTLRPASGYER